jgi:dolichyl-diphosphooligosaccharide--protein glycosyltransferase
MLLGLFIGILAPRNGLVSLTSGELLPAEFMVALLVAYESSKYLAKTPVISKAVNRVSRLDPYILLGALIVIAFLTLGFTSIGGKFYSVIMPILRNSQAAILASVGEQQPTDWGSFFYYLGIVLILAIVGLYFSFKRSRDVDGFIILATVTLAYFAGSMVRIIISLSPFLALLAGYGLSSVLKPFSQTISTPKEQLIHRKRVRTTPVMGRDYAWVSFLIVGILLLSYGNMIISVAPGTSSSSSPTLIEQLSPPDILPGGSYYDWLQAMSWLNYQTPPGSVVVAWWDYGYYISYVGNRTSVCDNATSNSTQIALVGLGMMEPNETASLQIFKKFNASYVLVYFGFMQPGLGGDEGKWTWMLKIAADSFAAKGLINVTKYDNTTSGGDVAQPLFFNSTLYRLLFNGEPSSSTNGIDEDLVYAMGTATVEGISTEPFPAVNPNTSALSTWNSALTSSSSTSSYFATVTTIDPYGPMFFQEAFVSSNDLVKIYKINYAPLYMIGNLALNVTATHVYTNGTAIITAKNTGGTSTPAIPFNYYTDSTGRQLYGSVWLNGTQPVSLQTFTIWNSTTSSWTSLSGIYNVNPGQSVTFEVTGLNSTILQNAYNRGKTLPIKVEAAYDPEIYAAAQVAVESS